MEFDFVSIGKRIKKARQRSKITQEKLAELIDVSNIYIYYIESGKRRVSLPLLVRIAKELDVSLDDLVFGDLENH
ncbi:MAG: helix-turn-helix domain-containing protein [Oscillospiraceae bacterium]|nr:helix-turn-helix domain-containing protein [Oscillospiraceae bacterium]